MYVFVFHRSVHLFFVCYTVLLMIRIVGSWVPQINKHHFMRFICHYTDPYLNFFRRIIPPIGGVFDLSPLLAFFALRILEGIILSFFR